MVLPATCGGFSSSLVAIPLSPESLQAFSAISLLGLLILSQSQLARAQKVEYPSFPVSESLGSTFGPATGMASSTTSGTFVWVSSDTIYRIRRSYDGTVLFPQTIVFPDTVAYRPLIQPHLMGEMIVARKRFSGTNSLIARLFRESQVDPTREFASGVDSHDWGFLSLKNGRVIYGFRLGDSPYFMIDDPVSGSIVKSSTAIVPDSSLYNGIQAVERPDGSIHLYIHRYSGVAPGFYMRKIDSSGAFLDSTLTALFGTGAQREFPFIIIPSESGKSIIVWAVIEADTSISSYRFRRLNENMELIDSTDQILKTDLTGLWNARQRLLDGFINKEGKCVLCLWDENSTNRVELDFESGQILSEKQIADSPAPRNVYLAPIFTTGWIEGWGNDTGPFARARYFTSLTTTSSITTTTAQAATTTFLPSPVLLQSTAQQAHTTSEISTTTSGSPSSVSEEAATTLSPGRVNESLPNSGLIAGITAAAVACLAALGASVFCLLRRKKPAPSNPATPLRTTSEEVRRVSQYETAPRVYDTVPQGSGYEQPGDAFPQGGVVYEQLRPTQVPYGELGVCPE